jgi:hypothetical protein
MLFLQLLDTKAVGVRREKMYKLDEHVACSVAGITGALTGPTVLEAGGAAAGMT